MMRILFVGMTSMRLMNKNNDGYDAGQGKNNFKECNAYLDNHKNDYDVVDEDDDRRNDDEGDYYGED